MTAALELEGILPALITPFTPDGSEVDVTALAAVVERCVAAGVGGLVPTGSTGEFPTLSTAERRIVAGTVLEAADGRVPTVVGTGALATADAVALSVHAEQSGAAAVMVVPPFYEAPTWRELLAHFATVADAISIPIMYYNIPGATGTTLTVEQLAELRRVANVTTFKDTSGDAVAGTEAFQLAGDLPVVLNGWDTLTFSALAAGVRAVVWGSASFMPAECVHLHRLLIDDLDLAAARELWAKLWPICRLLETTSYTSAVKAACGLVGLDTGPVRAPLLPLEPETHAELGRRLQAAGVIAAEVAG